MFIRDGVYYGIGFSSAGLLCTYLSNLAWGAPLFFLAAFCLYFFRDPERRIPEGPVAVSPADGKVVQVRTLEGGWQRISVFLNIFDVHVNRIPVAGRVTERHYQPGRFRMAHREEASTENEQASLTIQGEDGCVLVKQIAGLVARRIVCNKQVGDIVVKGERFGWIKFGSRTDLFLGPEWEILVREGDKVYGGSSALARRRDALS